MGKLCSHQRFWFGSSLRLIGGSWETFNGSLWLIGVIEGHWETFWGSLGPIRVVGRHLGLWGIGGRSLWLIVGYWG